MSSSLRRVGRSSLAETDQEQAREYPERSEDCIGEQQNPRQMKTDQRWREETFSYQTSVKFEKLSREKRHVKGEIGVFNAFHRDGSYVIDNCIDGFLLSLSNDFFCQSHERRSFTCSSIISS